MSPRKICIHFVAELSLTESAVIVFIFKDSFAGFPERRYAVLHLDIRRH